MSTSGYLLKREESLRTRVLQAGSLQVNFAGVSGMDHRRFAGKVVRLVFGRNLHLLATLQFDETLDCRTVHAVVSPHNLISSECALSSIATLRPEVKLPRLAFST